MDADLSEIRARLRSIPWKALTGFASQVEASLQETLAGTPTDEALEKLLKQNRRFTSPQRQAVAEAIIGASLWRRRLEFEGGSPLLATFLEDLAGCTRAEVVEIFESRLVLSSQALRVPSTFGDTFSLPDWLVEIIAREKGLQAGNFAASLNLPGPICFRANGLKTTRQALADVLFQEGVATRRGLFAENSLIVTQGRPNIYGLRSYRQGLFQVQDEGSQLLGELLEAKPNEQILDYCAGAGGKTLLLGSILKSSGKLWAYDPDLKRLDRLARRAATSGLTILEILRSEPPETLQVDRVLVDAPCSELGVLRRGPDLRFRTLPESLHRWPPIQLQILERAQQHLRRGGRLVYATCTIRREENQEVAQAFEKLHPDFVRVMPGKGWLPDSLIQEGYFVSSPDTHGTDAFFAAVFERR